MNICNQHICNPTCYKTNVDASKNLCKYGFPQPLINEIHFNIETRLLHIKWIDKWLNNANPWILSALRCNHDLKFIVTFGKDNKSLIYYIIYYITKKSIYTSHMYFLQIIVQTTKIINSNYNSIYKSWHLLICCLNTVGSQQEISTTRPVSYFFNLPNHKSDHDFIYLPWYSLLAWMDEWIRKKSKCSKW
jgi:hypothetical protein